jgi:hypothetical protein
MVVVARALANKIIYKERKGVSCVQRLTTFSIMTLSIMTLSIMTLSIMTTFSIIHFA